MTTNNNFPDTVIIIPSVAPDFTFSDSGYCNTDANPVPVPLNPGGSFFAVTALLDTVPWVDPVTGEVYLDSVTAGSTPLSICYTPNATCTSTLCDPLEIELFVQPVIQQQGNLLLVDTIYGEHNWALNGSPLPFQGNAIQVNSSGQYTIEAISPGGHCVGYDTLDIVVSVPEWVLSDQQAFLYPNPGNGQVDLVTDLGNGHAFDLEVVDVLGKQVLEVFGQSDGVLSLDLSEFPAGVYLFRLRSEVGVKVIRYLRE